MVLNITPIMENQIEKKMENEMETLGPFKGIYRDSTPMMENQMEKKMENEMETTIIILKPRAPNSSGCVDPNKPTTSQGAHTTRPSQTRAHMRGPLGLGSLSVKPHSLLPEQGCLKRSAILVACWLFSCIMLHHFLIPGEMSGSLFGTHLPH